jgi:hypothetical protein
MRAVGELFNRDKIHHNWTAYWKISYQYNSSSMVSLLENYQSIMDSLPGMATWLLAFFTISFSF